MWQRLPTKRDIAALNHRFLPEEIRGYLNRRGILDPIIDHHLLGWNGKRITIPVFDEAGNVLAFRYAKSPDDPTDSPKVISEVGSGAALYGRETLAANPSRIVICEGEFDRLVLEANGFPAVTSTAGARVFLDAWASLFDAIPKIYVCFDRDAAGEDGARHVRTVLPRAKIVRLPDEVGDKGDVTDYFVRLGRTREDFEELLRKADEDDDGDTVPRAPEKPPRPHRLRTYLGRLAEKRKARVRIEAVICRSVELVLRGRVFRARCPFHAEKSPSFVVYPETQSYFCFGCGAQGDAVTFLMNERSITFRTALEALDAFH